MAKALAGFKCRPLGKHCNGARRLFVIRYARYYTLSEVRDYWRNKADVESQYFRNRLRCKGRLVRPPLTLTLMLCVVARF
jgi:hypothetical protein